MPILATKRRLWPLIALLATTACTDGQSPIPSYYPFWVIAGEYESVDSLLPGQSDAWCEELLPDKARSLGLSSSSTCWVEPRACRQSLTFAPTNPPPDLPVNEYWVGSGDPFREYTVTRNVTLIASSCAKDQPFEVELEGFYSHQRYEKTRNHSPRQSRYRPNALKIEVYVDDDGVRWTYNPSREVDLEITVDKQHQLRMNGDYLRTRAQVHNDESPSDE